jgi:hypothetical protein
MFLLRRIPRVVYSTLKKKLKYKGLFLQVPTSLPFETASNCCFRMIEQEKPTLEPTQEAL